MQASTETDTRLTFYKQPCHVPHAQEGAGDHHEGGAEGEHVGELAEVGHSQAALDLADHQDEEATEEGEEEEREAVLEVEASLQLDQKLIHFRQGCFRICQRENTGCFQKTPE